MNYRIYIRQSQQNDQLGANGREVIIVMVGISKSWLTVAAGTIANAFSNNGWSLSNPGIQIQWGIDIEGVDATESLGYSARVDVKASVFNTFSDQQIQDGASKILSQFFTVKQIAVATLRPADIYNVPGEKQVSGVFGNTKVVNTNNAKTNSNTTKNTVVTNNSNNSDSGGIGDYFGNFFGSLGTGLGISTPLVGAGLLILAIVILKR